eukprot:3396112-Pyramimonas_sp.AAC.1
MRMRMRMRMRRRRRKKRRRGRRISADECGPKRITTAYAFAPWEPRAASGRPRARPSTPGAPIGAGWWRGVVHSTTASACPRHPLGPRATWRE